jgi:hypothetical protein
MTANLQNPIFTDEAKAIEHVEADRWPNGVTCPLCGVDNVTKWAARPRPCDYSAHVRYILQRRGDDLSAKLEGSVRRASSSRRVALDRATDAGPIGVGIWEARRLQ